MRRLLIATVCLALFSGLTAFPLAQAELTEINGTVRDASERPLPGATVTLNGPERDQTVTATTNAEGRYRFEGVAAGTYAISFSRDGFVTVERPPFRMLASFKARIDAILKVSPA